MNDIQQQLMAVSGDQPNFKLFNREMTHVLFLKTFDYNYGDKLVIILKNNNFH